MPESANRDNRVKDAAINQKKNPKRRGRKRAMNVCTRARREVTVKERVSVAEEGHSIEK